MNSIGNYATSLFDGKCINKFESMCEKAKIETIVKTLAIAFIAGIITALLVPVLALAVFIVAGVSAFSYLTVNYSALNWGKDLVSTAIEVRKSL